MSNVPNGNANVLNNDGFRNIIYSIKANCKKPQKKQKKELTNGGGGDIISNVPQRTGAEQKESSKNLKKCLTNEKCCGKMQKLFHGAQLQDTAVYLVN